MNNIEEAAALLERGWCTGELVDDQDRYCAVGAVAVTTDVMEFHTTEGLEDLVNEAATYSGFDKTPEAKALADEVMESDWFANQSEDFREVMVYNYSRGDYCDVVLNFNDKQKSKEPVIEMFRYAAKRMH